MEGRLFALDAAVLTVLVLLDVPGNDWVSICKLALVGLLLLVTEDRKESFFLLRPDLDRKPSSLEESLSKSMLGLGNARFSTAAKGSTTACGIRKGNRQCD